MSRTGNTGVSLELEREQKLKEPVDYRVVLLNDDYTTMEFVVAVLVTVFGKTVPEAEHIMMDVHVKGRGVVGMYTYDIACSKAEQVHHLARREEYPLRCIVEQA